MSLSMLARSSALRQNAVIGSRAFHVSKIERSEHGHYHHLPFQWPGEKKATFGAKVGVFLAFGFSIPFLAAAFQLKKAGGAEA